MDAKAIADAFGAERGPEVDDAASRLGQAIVDLIALMQGDDEGGAVRVGHTFVVLGARLAGIPRGQVVRIPR